MTLKDRLFGRSVVDLAQQVDDALGALAYSRGLQEAAREALRLADADVAVSEAAVRAARDALFREHPELAPTEWPGPEGTVSATDQWDHQGGDVEHPTPDNPALLPGQDPSKFEVVEVDDANDPKWTAGFSTTPTDESEDLPPLEWQEHDDE